MLQQSLSIVGIMIFYCLAQLFPAQVMAQEETLQKPLTAQELFDKGSYKQASILAEKQKNMAGYALAVRAALVQGGYIERGKKAEEWLERAEQNSLRALKLDKRSLRNRLDAAIIVSYMAKEKHSVRLVNIAKHAIELLIIDYPDSALAHGALASWHSEISAAGFLPRLLLGASRAKARKSYAVAIPLDGTKLALNLEYAKFLARGDRGEQKSAEKLLSQIVEAVPHDAFERLLQKNAKNFIIAVKTGKKQEIRRIFKQYSAFPDF